MSQERKRPAFEPPAQLIRRTDYDPEMARPPATTAGAAIVLLRSVVGAIWVVSVAGLLPQLVASGDIDVIAAGADAIGAAQWVFVAIGVTALAIDVVMAVLILRGRNWPRVVMMTLATIFITSTFIGWWFFDAVVSLETTLISLGLDVLLLLALSSRSAAAYARRREQPRAAPAADEEPDAAR